METAPVPRTVKLGDILPGLRSFESVLGSLKSYRLWPVVLREALLDKAISGIACTPEEMNEVWGLWCKRNHVDPAAPVFEGLSVAEMRHAALREKRIEKFKENSLPDFSPSIFVHARESLIE